MHKTTNPYSNKQKGPHNHVKTSVTCTNMPESLFDAAAAKRHFSKFGRVSKILMRPKHKMCVIEYDSPIAAERAVLNAGAYDGFIFDVTKQRVRRRSKRDDDPDWLPDSDVEEELSAMSGMPIKRQTRQKPMEVEKPEPKKIVVKKVKKELSRKQEDSIVPVVSATESPSTSSIVVLPLGTADAALELYQLRSRVANTPDEQWRLLDARDKILRSWGGTGARVKIGGATIGTCPDMCPEKERLHRQAEHQVMTLETTPNSDGWMEPTQAVKQYSRSSADQEIPMCYELRPPHVLLMTCSYLLNEIADTERQVSLADWFHFMWDRLRGIRKDITQQALCCGESIRLMEMCARFHAHCAARLADLEHTQFDQKLNTDNLTKCLQTLKHMYADVSVEQKPNEAEFRCYIALLNLGDSNFWWEIKRLPREIQKSESIMFAIQVFNALDNNNYVRFFRLIKEKATYLQACILLRYFNDVRARALARIVKSYSPRGGSRYPVYELMLSLAFETPESMKSFISHYGLRFGKVDDGEISVILDRNQFIEDSDPYPIARAKTLIESKRRYSVGETIAGGSLPEKSYLNHSLHTSFNRNGNLKESALLAEDQNYDTLNDSNRDINSLKAELEKLTNGKGIIQTARKVSELHQVVATPISDQRVIRVKSEDQKRDTNTSDTFTFTKPRQIASKLVVGFEIDTNDNHKFVFSSPYRFNKIISEEILPKTKQAKTLFERGIQSTSTEMLPMSSKSENSNLFNQFSSKTVGNSNSVSNSLFNPPNNKPITDSIPSKLFSDATNKNIFEMKKDYKSSVVQQNSTQNNPFAQTNENIFNSASSTKTNIFAKPIQNCYDKVQNIDPKSIFRSVQQNRVSSEGVDKAKSIFGNALKNTMEPINGTDGKYSIFKQSNINLKNSVAANIFNSGKSLSQDVYEFNDNEDGLLTHESNAQCTLREQKSTQIKYLEEQAKLEELQREELKKQELQKLEEEKALQEERRKQELRRLEEKRMQEERVREELKKKLEEEKRQAEEQRRKEQEKRFLERVNNESNEVIDELLNEINLETVSDSIKTAIEDMKQLTNYAVSVRDDMVEEICSCICEMEMKAELFLTCKLMKKWLYTWRRHCIRNRRRRNLIDETPVWLPDHSPEQEAKSLKRRAERSVLVNMKAIRNGYKFTGEPKTSPTARPYNIAEIVKPSLLKNRRYSKYTCDKCFFWKVTLVIQDANTWINRKVELRPFLLSLFSDSMQHESDCLLQVQKYTFKNLMDIGISVSLASEQGNDEYSETLNGTNALLFYVNENDDAIMGRMESILRCKYAHQLVPLSIITSCKDKLAINSLRKLLSHYVEQKLISSYRLDVVDDQNTFESLNALTKTSLKWLAKHCPPAPRLEVDLVKSLCQRYLGTEIWCRLKSERQNRLGSVLNNPNTLIAIFNLAVDKLLAIITDESLFNYPPFPLELHKYLNKETVYPKPYEFVTNNLRSAENVAAIKDFMKRLKLIEAPSNFRAFDQESMQDQIRDYCNRIGWFEDPEAVVCKVVAAMPDESSQFDQRYEIYDIIDVLNIVVYEKINSLSNSQSLLAVYDKSALKDYRIAHWWYETKLVCNRKHKIACREDEIDEVIAAKRRKLSESLYNDLTFNEKDTTMVEQSIKAVDNTISRLQCLNMTVEDLERKVERQKLKSIELENMLRAALNNV